MRRPVAASASTNRSGHPCADRLAVADAVLDERHAVVVGEQVQRVLAGERLDLGSDGAQVALVPDAGRERVGVADQHRSAESARRRPRARSGARAMVDELVGSARPARPSPVAVCRRAIALARSMASLSTVKSRPCSGTHRVRPWLAAAGAERVAERERRGGRAGRLGADHDDPRANQAAHRLATCSQWPTGSARTAVPLTG